LRERVVHERLARVSSSDRERIVLLAETEYCPADNSAVLVLDLRRRLGFFPGSHDGGVIEVTLDFEPLLLRESALRLRQRAQPSAAAC
jgi:hypothetical protein